MTALALLLLFSAFQIIQFHHHHDDVPVKTPTDKSARITVSQKCDICDYVLKKQNSHLEHQEITIPVVQSLPLSHVGFHYQTHWYFAYPILTDNKGPPAHS